MPQSYQTISAGLRQRAHQFEPFGWLVSLLAFFAIGLLDDIAIRFRYIFFWGLFLGPLVSLIRRAPDLAFLSAVSFGTMNIPTDGDRYQQTLLSPLRLTIVLICYSAMFALIRTRLSDTGPHIYFTLRVAQLLSSILIACTSIGALLVISQYISALLWLDYQRLNQNVEQMLFPTFFLTIASVLLTTHNRLKDPVIET
jgi:hypothetical protein